MLLPPWFRIDDTGNLVPVTAEEFHNRFEQKFYIDEQHEAGFTFDNDVKGLADFCLI